MNVFFFKKPQIKLLESDLAINYAISYIERMNMIEFAPFLIVEKSEIRV